MKNDDKKDLSYPGHYIYFQQYLVAVFSKTEITDHPVKKQNFISA